MELIWKYSRPASCFHAAWALFHKLAPSDARLAEALADPVARLGQACDEEHVPARVFVNHLVPLSIGTLNLRELAERALIKTIGRGETGIRLNRFHNSLVEISSGFARVVPEKEAHSATTGSLQPDWARRGAGLLTGIANESEPAVLVEGADIVLVFPYRQGLGVSYLPYNLVGIEMTSDDPVPQLPEVIRLAWLLSMLNLDLPRYAEQVKSNALWTVGALALIPIALKAAQTLELAVCDEQNIRQAVENWLPFEENLPTKAETVLQWWDVYQTMRPEFPAALNALDRLLA